jgi:tetratricopeptide (TPR) repeat protein
MPEHPGRIEAMCQEHDSTMYLVLAGLAIGLLVVLYLGFAPGPRRRRAFRRAQKLLAGGSWKEALALVESLDRKGISQGWRVRLRNCAGECHQRAVDQALKERNFEDALEHSLQAARLLGLDENDQRGRVVEAMLAEVRRLFAESTGAEATKAVLALVERINRLAGCAPPEATFWQALCEIRQGAYEPAQAALMQAFEQVGRQVLDPALYLGILLHRLGRPQEALRYLAEANRIDSNCPFTTLQMGVSLIASGGDSGLALRALQRALGSRGLGMWQAQPDRAWVESFPEGRSYIRRLSSRYRYVCPLLGGDLNILLRQGQLALAQAFYRQERFQEAADQYARLLQDSPPTVMLLRGYGLSLARLGQYDQAYKHLRIALEQEEPKDPFTAGYLAQCGALGKPTNADDKPRNITWSLRLLAHYPVMGNAEWAGLIGSVHAEARKIGMTLGAEEQILLCDSLASVQATDPQAALAFSHLAGTFPDALRPVYAWLYARAATVHGIRGPQDLDLFARAFRDPNSARTFFEQQKWDLSEVEYSYLERCARLAPGQFPAILGTEYPPRGEAFLLSRSRQQEEAGHKEPARTSAEVLLKLAPQSVAAHDRLACLHYRQGELDRAIELLEGWRQLRPADHWPLVRAAIIEQERGNALRRQEAIDHALGLTRGPLRAAVAYLGARLALRSAAEDLASGGSQPPGVDHATVANASGSWAAGALIQGVNTPRSPADDTRTALAASQRLLQECLRDEPDHVEAQWCLAAVRSVLGDHEGLASQAAVMDRPAVSDARFHFLGAVCHLAAQKYRGVIELGVRAATADPSLEVESRHVMAWAHLHLGEVEAARESFRRVAADEKSPSAQHARAMLGKLSFQRGETDEAIGWWSGIDSPARRRWALEEPLRQTVLLAGLQALADERFEQAAERFREAGKLGLRDRRLGGLVTLAVVKAGQRLLYEQNGNSSNSKHGSGTEHASTGHARR